MNIQSKDDLNEKLAQLRVVDEYNYFTGYIKNLYVYPELEPNEGMILYYVSEFEDAINEETFFVKTTDFNKFISLFKKSVYIDNPIDQKIKCISTNKIYFEKENNGLIIYNKKSDIKNDKNTYIDNLNKNTFKYSQSEHKIIREENIDKNKYVKFDNFFQDKIIDDIYNNHSYLSRDKLENIINRTHEDIINKNISKLYIDASITNIFIDDKINIKVKPKTINANTELVFQYNKPESNDSLFVNFTKRMNVKSVDELENKYISLTREIPFENSPSVNNWYIDRQVKEQNYNPLQKIKQKIYNLIIR